MTTELWAEHNIEELLHEHQRAEEAHARAEAAHAAAVEARKAAEAAVLEEHKVMLGLHKKLYQADKALSLAFANMAADTCESPITRAELVAEIKEAIATQRQLSPEPWNAPLEEKTVRMLETAQITTGHGMEQKDLERVHAMYLGRRGDSRQIYLYADQRESVWDVLQKHCPVRSDSGRLAPPYRLEKDEKVRCGRSRRW